MLSNNDSTGSTGIVEPTTLENAPVDIPVNSTPTVHKQSMAIPYTSGHVMRDENLITLGNEMVGHVVGPMPVIDFLELLPRNSQKSPPFGKKPFVKLLDESTEPKIKKINLFVRNTYSIQFLLSMPWIALHYFID